MSRGATLLAAALALAQGALPAPAETPTDSLRGRSPPGAAERLLDRFPNPIVEALHAENSLLLGRDAPGSPAGFTGFRALVIFQAGRERVMRLISQTSRQKEYRPELRAIEPIRRGAGWQVDEHRIRVLFTNLVYRVRSQVDFEQGTIEWRLDPDFDNDLRRIEGFWHLYALADDRTLGHFGTLVDVSASLPRFLQDAVTRKQLPSVVDNTRRWVDSDGRWRP